MSVADEVAAESTAILDFHFSKVCSGLGYWNRGTRGDLTRGGAKAAGVKI